MVLNPFVKRSEATTKGGKVKKGYMSITFKNGQVRYKKELPKKSKAKVIQVKKCVKTTKENPDGTLTTDKKCEVIV